MNRHAGRTLALTALLLPLIAVAAEVFALRVGYWEFTSDMPGQAAPDKTFRCLADQNNLRN